MKNLECTCTNAVPFWRCFHDKWTDDETFSFLTPEFCTRIEPATECSGLHPMLYLFLKTARLELEQTLFRETVYIIKLEKCEILFL